MASYAKHKSTTQTLSTTVVDTVTFDQLWDGVEVVNLTGTSTIAFTVDGTTPVVDGDDCYQVDAGSSLKLDSTTLQSGASTVIKLIGSGNKYRVTGLIRMSGGI